ncbi:ABC transporter permease [Devosia sp. LjRoot16]|uniref:ABC transporter permease n=1 Tax=Devosia sp. LjRoot16 TaxID=3342271 RepID=UPI003ED093AA
MMRLLKIYMQRPELVALVVLIVFTTYFAAASNGLFLSNANVRGMFSLYPELAILALGFSLLMIAGEFDLSIGSVMGLCPIVLCAMINFGIPFWPAFILALVVGAAIGLFNSAVTLRFGIPSFITTLGTLFMARSVAVVLYSSGLATTLDIAVVPTWAFSEPLGIFRVSAIWLVALALLVWLLLEKTNFGNWIRATGGSVEAAKAMGIPTSLVKTVCFMICSTLAGLAGIIQVVRIGSPIPSMGESMELQAIAAAVIGGIALSGGVGNIVGVVIGMAIIRVIDSGMIMSRVDASWFKFAIGFLIVCAVIANHWLERRARNIKLEVAQ